MSVCLSVYVWNIKDKKQDTLSPGERENVYVFKTQRRLGQTPLSVFEPKRKQKMLCAFDYACMQCVSTQCLWVLALFSLWVYVETKTVRPVNFGFLTCMQSQIQNTFL